MAQKVVSEAVSAAVWEAARFGQTRVWWRSDGAVAETVIAGHMTLEVTEFLSRKFDQLLAQQAT